MKEPREDDERLSALLEGRVEGRQREEMLEHLAAADDDYEVFTDTAAVLRALEEEDARGQRGMAPPSMLRRRRWPSPRKTLAVTGVVMLLLAGWWLIRGRGASVGGVPLQMAMRADAGGQGLPEGWDIPAPATTVRGGGGGAANDARAVSAGAMLVDLAVAIRARDTERVRERTAQLISEFDPGTTSSPLLRIQASPGAPPDSLNAWLEAATNELAGLGRGSLELGAWIEAARLAAHDRNPAFFQDGGTEGMLRRAERLARGSREAEAAVRQVREAVRPPGTPRWEDLETGLEETLAQLSG